MDLLRPLRFSISWITSLFTQLQIAVGVCRANPTWSFDECATFCADTLRAQKTYNDQGRVVASVETGGDADDDGIVPDMSVEDRYYKPKEFGTLTKQQKKGLRIKRDIRLKRKGGGKGRGGGGRGRGGNAKKQKGGNGQPITFSKKDRKMIKSPTSHIAAMSVDKKDDDDSDESSTASSEPKGKKQKNSNRKNKALQRKQK